MNDLEKGLSSVLLRAGGATPTSPAALVVNLSIGTVASYPSDCDANVSIAIRNLIRQLRTAGVPVIASTGNYQIQTALSHPACSEYSIKAASVLNDEIGYTLATKSNIAALNQFTYPIFWRLVETKILLGSMEQDAFQIPICLQAGAHLSLQLKSLGLQPSTRV